MKKNSVLLCLSILCCSREDEKDLPTKQDQFSDEVYRQKVSEMEAILYK